MRFYFYVVVLLVCISVHQVYAVPVEVRKGGIRSVGTGVKKADIQPWGSSCLHLLSVKIYNLDHIFLNGLLKTNEQTNKPIGSGSPRACEANT